MGETAIPGIAAACMLLISSASAQWAPTNGPRGPIIETMSSDGASLFAFTNNYGVVKSGDRGSSWRSLEPLPEGIYPAMGLASRGDTVYLGTSRGIHIHDGEGSPWRRANDGLGGDSAVHAIAFAWDGVLAATVTGRLFRSVDRGGHWTRLDAGPGAWRTSWQNPILAVDGDCAYLAVAGGVRRTLDRGRTWSMAIPDANDTLVNIVACAPPFVFALTGMGIYRSADSGGTWKRLALGGTADSGGFLSMSAIGSRVYVGQYVGGMFTSADYGESWIQDSVFFNSNNAFLYGTMLRLGGDLIAPTQIGVYRSSDQGHTWIGANTGIASVAATELVSAGPGRLATLAGSWLYQTSDKGLNWDRIPIPDVTIAAIGSVGGDLFLLSPEFGLYRTRNLGSDWERLLDPDEIGQYPGGRFFRIGEELYYPFASRDGTALIRVVPWNSPNTPLTGWKGGALFDMAQCGGLTYAIVSDSLLRYDPVRKEWQPTSSVPSVNDMRVLGSQKGSVLIGTSKNGLFRSADSGESWTHDMDSATIGGIHSLLEVGDHVFAAGDSGVAVSSENGTWTRMNQGLPVNGRYKSPAGSLFSQDGYLYAAYDGKGIWKFPLDQIGSAILGKPAARSQRPAPKWLFVAGGVRFKGEQGGPARDLSGRAAPVHRPTPFTLH